MIYVLFFFSSRQETRNENLQIESPTSFAQFRLRGIKSDDGENRHGRTVERTNVSDEKLSRGNRAVTNDVWLAFQVVSR